METKQETAVEILENRPFEDSIMGSGQYTHKIYHIGSRLPRIVQAIAPASMLKVEERAWNAYPHCKTIITNPFLGERFELIIETIHLSDKGTTENALGLDEETLKKRTIHRMDIGKDQLTDPQTDGFEQYDPTTFVSVKTGRGPLTDGWQSTCQPAMCAYKLVTARFQVFGIQGRTESYIEGAETEIFLKFHKQLFCLIDEWYGLTMEQIREMEEQVKHELDKKLDELKLETRETTNRPKATIPPPPPPLASKINNEEEKESSKGTNASQGGSSSPLHPSSISTSTSNSFSTRTSTPTDAISQSISSLSIDNQKGDPMPKAPNTLLTNNVTLPLSSPSQPQP